MLQTVKHTSEVGYGGLQRVKQHQMICYGVVTKGQRTSRGLSRCGTKGQTTSGFVPYWYNAVKQHQIFVTECYKGSKNITGLLRSGTNGQTKSEMCYRVISKGQTTSEVYFGVVQRVKQH